MIPSRYNRIVPWADRYIVYNCLSNAMALMDADQAEALREGKTHLLRSDLMLGCVRGGFLVADDCDEIQVFKHTWYRAQHDQSLASLSISPTLRCNMVCRYCLAHKSNEEMNGETADRVISLAARHMHSASRFAVTWMGGEPLLALDIVEYISKKIHEVARQQQVEYRGAMFTNGYDLDEATVSRLVSVGVSQIVVAVDGPKAIHERRRPHSEGKSTFDRIISNVMAASTRLSVILQCVADDENVDSAWQLYDDLRDKGCFGNGIRFRIAKMDCDATAGRVKNEYPLSAAELDRACIANIRKRYGAPGLIIPYPELNPGCSYQRFSSWSVGPDGSLYKCLKAPGVREWAVGSLDDTPRWTSPGMGRWMHLDPCDRDSCRQCSVLPLCSGGCSLALFKTGKSRCTPYKWTLDDWLKLTMEIRQASKGNEA